MKYRCKTHKNWRYWCMTNHTVVCCSRQWRTRPCLWITNLTEDLGEVPTGKTKRHGASFFVVVRLENVISQKSYVHYYIWSTHIICRILHLIDYRKIFISGTHISYVEHCISKILCTYKLYKTFESDTVKYATRHLSFSAYTEAIKCVYTKKIKVTSGMFYGILQESVP